MEDSGSYRKPHFPNPGMNSSLIQYQQQNPITQGKSYLQFLLKALFFVVLVIVLPLFPSKAPDFANDTILDKFWELIHLLFIGIAVSYGLFSRRNVEMGYENQSNVENVESYMPRMFDGCENPCGSGEKRVLEGWSSQNFVGKDNSTVYFDAKCKPRLEKCGDAVENLSGFKNKNVGQAWNSQYFQGESMVFVAQPDYAVDGFVKPKSVVDDEPLGLPIRSLNPKVKNQEKCEFVTRSESGFGSKGSSNTFEWSRNRKLGDLAPINLLEKFNQAMASPSPTLKRSSSRKMERGRRVGSALRPSHFRPMSVDEAQFESLKARSFRSTLSFSSQTSSNSSSPEEEYASVDSAASEGVNSETVHLGKRKKSSRASSPSELPLEQNAVNEKVSMSGLHSRGYSSCSFFEEKSSNNYAKKELSGSRSSGDQYGSGKKELGAGSLRSEKKSPSLSKTSSRGKSVRTIRCSRLTTPDKVENNQKMFDDAISMRKEKLQNGGLVDNLCDMLKPAFPKYQKEQMQDFFNHVDLRSEEESESEAENFEVSSKDRVEAAAAAAFCNSVNVAAGADSEVDKKAGAFIAKFREQIRLQKVASNDRSRGLGISENRFRTLSAPFTPSIHFSHNKQIIQCCSSQNSGHHRVDSGNISHYEEILNRRLVVFLSVTTSLFPNLSSSAKTKTKSPFDERRLLEQNKRIQKENNAPEEFPSFIREGFQVKVVTPENYTTRESGLIYRDFAVGEGDCPQAGQQVMFHYIGYNESGRRIDSSYNQGTPARIRMGTNALVPGFEEGIRDMKPGGKRRIIIPPELGPPVGPSTFFSSKQFEVFDVELLSIQNCVRRTIAGFYSDFVCE